MKTKDEDCKIVRIGIETKDLGYAIYSSKDGWHDLKFRSACRDKKDAMERYYQLKAENIGKKNKQYFKVFKIIADSLNEELANRFDPTGQGIEISQDQGG